MARPEGWTVIDRAFTKAEARYIPNGPGTTTDMAHPTRTGDIVVFSAPAVPVRRRHPGHADRPFCILRPARLRTRRAEPRCEHQHAGNVHRRWPRYRQGSGRWNPHDRHRADDRLRPWRARAAAESGRGAPRRAEGGRLTHPGAAARPQRLPRSARPDDDDDRRAQRVGRRSRAARDIVRRGCGGLPRRCVAAGGRRQRGRLAGQLRPARGPARDRCGERVGPRCHVVRQPRVRLRRRTAAPTSGARRIPVPRRQHRRRDDRAEPRMGAGHRGLRLRRHPGRRDRHRTVEHPRTRECRRHRRTPVPRRGRDDQDRIGETAQAGCEGAGGADSPGRDDRRQPDRRQGRRRNGTARSSGSPKPSRTRRSTRSSLGTRTASPTSWSGTSPSPKASTWAAATPSSRWS